MPYTYTSLVVLWLVTLGLFAVSASGAVSGRWLILLLLAALATPALILRRFKDSSTLVLQLEPARGVARSRRRPSALFKAFDRSSSEAPGVAVAVWENVGGARRRRATGGS
jgi:hypothetical protein